MSTYNWSALSPQKIETISLFHIRSYCQFNVKCTSFAAVSALTTQEPAISVGQWSWQSHHHAHCKDANKSEKPLWPSCKCFLQSAKSSLKWRVHLNAHHLHEKRQSGKLMFIQKAPAEMNEKWESIGVRCTKLEYRERLSLRSIITSD